MLTHVSTIMTEYPLSRRNNKGKAKWMSGREDMYVWMIRVDVVEYFTRGNIDCDIEDMINISGAMSYEEGHSERVAMSYEEGQTERVAMSYEEGQSERVAMSYEEGHSERGVSTWMIEGFMENTSLQVMKITSIQVTTEAAS